jgi:hypothetical protein
MGRLVDRRLVDRHHEEETMKDTGPELWTLTFRTEAGTGPAPIAVRVRRLLKMALPKAG